MMVREDMDRHLESFLIATQMEFTGQLYAMASLPSFSALAGSN